MSNSYSAPNFNIDTSTNVAGLTSLKGSAPALTDLIYVYNGAVLTVESALSILKIIIGHTSTGAATASGRYGILTINAGQTVIFAGNATATNSGILMNPTTADTSSKLCKVNINGTAVSPCILTNQSTVMDTAQRWTITNTYGTILATYSQFNYSYLSAFGAFAVDSSKQTVGSSVTNSSFTAAQASNIPCFTLSAVPCDMTIDLSFNSFYTATAANTIYASSGAAGATSMVAGGIIKLDGLTLIDGGVTDRACLPIWITGGDIYLSARVNYANLIPTQVVPIGLTFTDLQDGTVKVTISNIASYRTQATNGVEDYIQLYDASNNARGGAASKTRYLATLDRKPANCFIVAGVPLSAMTGWYAKATSDNYNYSAASAAASTITPTLLPAAANIITGYGAGQNSTEITGTAIRESHTANQVLHSAGGNFIDESLADGNIAADTPWGLDHTGTRMDPDPDGLLEGYTAGDPDDPIQGKFIDVIKADVRFGTEYGPNDNPRAGDCHVPAAADVRKTVPVDNTVGTLEISFGRRDRHRLLGRTRRGI